MQKRSGHGNNHADKGYSCGNHQSSAVHILASMVMDEGRSGQRRIIQQRAFWEERCRNERNCGANPARGFLW
jgi:hypothetical protein